MHTTLVIGGYGFFGQRICEALATVSGLKLIIGGRDLRKAQPLAVRLGLPIDQAVTIDAHAPDLVQRLIELQVNTVIHTAGPFQERAISQLAQTGRKRSSGHFHIR